MCEVPETVFSVEPVPFTGFFNVGPNLDLGDRCDIAMRAMGWRPPENPGVAKGYVLVCGEKFTRGAPGESLDNLQRVASMIVAETGEEIIVGKAVCMVGEQILYQGIEKLRRASTEKMLTKAIEAAEEILFPVEKAKRILDPSKSRNRALIVRQAADAMVGVAGKNERAQIRAARRFIDSDWPGMNARRRNNLIRQASARIEEVPVRAVRGIRGVIEREGERTMKGARRAAIERHRFDINVSLTSADRESLRAAQQTSVTWLTNEYGVRASQFEGRAREIVERGLEEGLGRGQISEDLLGEFRNRVSGRTESYFRVYAAALVDRSRSRAELSSYVDAGITKFVAVAVQDEATTDFCRWVDGRVIDVERSISIMEDAEKAGSVDTMKAANPWATTETTSDGRTFWQANGTRLFEVNKTGLGTQSAGNYSTTSAGRNLEGNRIGAPPYHGLCRTTTVAET